MGKVIARKDIIEQDAIDWSVDYKSKLDKANLSQKETIDSLKAISALLSKINKDSGTETKLIKEIDRVKESTNARTRAENSLIKAIEKKKLATGEANKKTIAERVETNRLNTINRQNATFNNQLIGAYKKLNLERTIAKKKLLDLTIELGKNNAKTIQAGVAFSKLDKRVRLADETAGDFHKTVGNYKTGLGGAVKIVRNLVGVFGLYQGLRLAGTLFNEVKAINSVNTALKNILPSADAYAKHLDFAKQKAQDYGIEITSLTKNYTKFLASLKGTNLEGEKGIDIFDKVIKTSASLGNSQDETNGILTAFNQIISKGTVQSEELKGQLGDRIPGALNIMARALDVSIPKLTKMLENGEVLAEEALPKFADELEKTFGLENTTKIDNLTSAQARFSNTYKIFLTEVEQGNGAISKAFISVFNFGTSMVNAIAPTKKLSEKLEEQRTKLFAVESKLKDTNVKQEDKIKLIKELKKQHPGYLNNIDEESTNYEVLFKSLKKVNDELINKIILQKQDENIEKQNEKTGKQRLKFFEKEDELRTAIGEIIKNEKGFEIKSNKTLIEQAEDLQRQRLKKIDSDKEYAKSASNEYKNNIYTGNIWTELSSNLSSYTSAKNKLNKLENEGNLLFKKREELSKRLGIVEPKDDKKEEIKVIKQLTDAEKKRIAQLNESRKQSNSNLRISEIEEEIRINEAIISNESSSFDVRFKNAELLKDNLIKLSREREFEESRILEGSYRKNEISKDEYDNRLQIIAIQSNNNEIEATQEKENVVKDIIKSRFEYYKKSQENFTNSLTKEFDKELLVINSSYQKGEISKKQHDDKLQELNQKALKGLLEASKDSVENIIKNDESLLEDKQLTVEQKAELERTLHELEINLSNEKTQQKIDNEEKFREAVSKTSDFIAGAIGVDSNNLTEFIVGISDMFESESEKWAVSLSVIGDIVGSIGNISSELSDRRINDIDEQIEKSNEDFDNRLKNENLSDQQRKALERQKEVSEDKLNEKKKREQEKQWKRDKAIALGQAAISTSVAIIRALADPGGLAGLALSIAAGVVGATQIALIATQKMPKFKDGHYEGNYEGWAITNDGGEQEVHERNGKARLIQGVDTPTFMKKGDKIYKSEKDYYHRNNIVDDFNQQEIKIQKAQQKINERNSLSESQLTSIIAREVTKQANGTITKEIKNGFKNVVLKTNSPSSSARTIYTNKDFD